jgi:addiction module RelE/StbE family toxin
MKIVPNKRFEKRVAKLPVSIKKALVERLSIFIEDPFNNVLNNHSLHGKKRGYRSINITGDYRLIYEEYDTDVSRLIDIDTHSNLY